MKFIYASSLYPIDSLPFLPALSAKTQTSMTALPIQILSFIPVPFFPALTIKSSPIPTTIPTFIFGKPFFEKLCSTL